MNYWEYKRQEFLRGVLDIVEKGGRFSLKIGPFSCSYDLPPLDPEDKDTRQKVEWFLNKVSGMARPWMIHPHVGVTGMERNKIGFWVSEKRRSVFW